MGATTAPNAPRCQILSSQKVLPGTRPIAGAKTTPLSIADATVARFSPCAAVWLYDKNEASRNTDLFTERLQKTLRETLNDYRHFAGQLRWVVHESSEPVKLGRPVVVYGTDEDPGVIFTVARYDCSLSDVVPSEQERQGDRRVWMASDFPQDELLPGDELAFASSLSRFEGLPGASVQITSFACGGFALGIKITHCLSDAVCLVQFAKNWAQRTRASFAAPDHGLLSEEDALPRAVFDPCLLDVHAGALHGEHADPEKVRLARSLPMHRFDWWKTEAPGYPSWATASTQATRPTEEQLRGMALSPSTAPPWPTWDLSRPVDHVQIRFRGHDVRRMKAAAQAELDARGHGGSTGAASRTVVSRLDVLLALVWRLIHRARQRDDAEAATEPVYLNMTLGLRQRVAPPLPDAFVGSPLVLAHVALHPHPHPHPDADADGAPSLGAVAASLRHAVARFTPAAVAAYLHDAAHEVCPQRLWQAFLGTRHTLVTSWARAGCYEVSFWGRGERPRYVQGRMPRMDGVVQVVDVGEEDDYDVSLCLEREALGRLLGELERLRAFDG